MRKEGCRYAHIFQRIEPLQNLDRIFSKVVADFEEQWAHGLVDGWETEADKNGESIDEHALVDLDYYSTAEELTVVGPEKLKQALAALGLKTGGTVQQRAERLFLTKNTPLAKLDKKYFAKGSQPPGLNGFAATLHIDDSKEIALIEAKIQRLCDLLSEVSILCPTFWNGQALFHLKT